MTGIIGAAERYGSGKNILRTIMLKRERPKAAKSKAMLYQLNTGQKICAALSLLAMENIAEGQASWNGDSTTILNTLPKL